MSEGAALSRLSLGQAAFVVARRDFTAILFSKAFLFFLLGPLFFIGISLGAGLLGAKAASNADSPVLALAMAPADSAAMLEAREQLEGLLTMPEVAVVEPAKEGQAAALLNAGERNFGAVVTGTLQAPELIGTSERIERWRGEVALLAATAVGQAVDYPEVKISATTSSGASTRSARADTAIAALTLLFLLTMLLAGMVMSNLVEEKANKIIEVLAAAIPMQAVFLGKLFAMLAISFVGIAVWGGVAGIALAASGEIAAELPAPAVGWPLFAALFLIYFAMAYLLIGSIFLAIGAMAPTVRDVQTLSMPATILQLGVFFLATYAMSDTGSAAELFALAFPLSSPYAMVARAAQQPVLWTHLAALAWQAAWVALFVRAGASLFRKRVMKSGGAGGGRRRLLARRAA